MGTLTTFAKESGHGESAQAKLCPVGMSAGARMSARIIEHLPERVIASGGDSCKKGGIKAGLISLLNICLFLPALTQDIPSMKALAVKGDVRAQGQLARNYTYGKGVKRDYVEALRLAKQATEN